MFLFLKKQLLVDTDAGALMRAKQILDKAGIPYDVKTTTGENVLSRSFNAKAAEHLRRSYSDLSQQSYVYYLYVSRKDYPRAKELISGK